MSGIFENLGIDHYYTADSYYLPAGKEYQYEYAPEPSGT